MFFEKGGLRLLHAGHDLVKGLGLVHLCITRTTPGSRGRGFLHPLLASKADEAQAQKTPDQREMWS